MSVQSESEPASVGSLDCPFICFNQGLNQGTQKTVRLPVLDYMWIQIRLCHKMRQFLIESVLLMLSNPYLADFKDAGLPKDKICQVWFASH